jgi:hypothetical protein
MHARLALLLAVACLSSGCLVITLQPVYDDAALEVDETLAGTWRSEEPASTVVVERGEWKSYRVTYTARSASYTFVAYLTRIGDGLLLDLVPARGVEDVPLIVPAHGVCRLQHEGDRVTIAPFDYDWFTAAVRSKTLTRLETAFDARQNLILTSKTAALRAWILAHQKTADVFREPVVFTRAK